MRYKTLVHPEVFACELNFLKDQLRKTDSQQDAYLKSLIVASMHMANDYTGRQLNRATLQAYCQFKGVRIYEIHRGPVVSVSKVEVVTTENTVSELLSSDYYIIQEDFSCYLVIKETVNLGTIDYNRPDAVRITYVAGYNWEEESRFPEDITNAVALYASRMYLNPDNSIDERNTTSDNLLKKYRCPII